MSLQASSRELEARETRGKLSFWATVWAMHVNMSEEVHFFPLQLSPWAGVCGNLLLPLLFLLLLRFVRLFINMSSSYAAAISALITTNSLNPPMRPIPKPSPARTESRKTSPRPSNPGHGLPTAQRQQQPSEPLGSYEEQQENPADYDIGRQQPTSDSSTPVHIQPLMQAVCLCCRWLLQCGDWRDFCGPVPGGQKAGMGALFHRVALLGHGVRASSSYFFFVFFFHLTQ